MTMEKFLKEFSADVKTATEEGRKKLVAAVSVMKPRRPKKPFKKLNVFKSRKGSKKSSNLDKASSTSTNETEHMIQIEDGESPPSVYIRIDSTDDDVVNLEHPEQKKDGLSPEDTITEDINDPNSEDTVKNNPEKDTVKNNPKKDTVINNPENDPSEESRSVDAVKNNPEKDPIKKDHSAKKVTTEQIFVVTNFIVDIPSAVFGQLSSRPKTHYPLISMIFSITTVLICVTEFIYRGQEGKVSWKWKEKLPWFYYPSPSYRPFGSLNDIIGLLCAFFECALVTTNYVLTPGPIKISSWPLIFSFCLMCSKFQKGSQRKTLTKH